MDFVGKTDSSYLYKSESKPTELLQFMESLKSDRKFSDFTINIERQHLKTHKFLLYFSSDYFKAMLDHDTIEARDNQLSIPNISLTAMKAILEYFYTFKIMLNDDNVQEILIASNILLVPDVVDACVKFIRSRIENSNCIGVLLVAHRCNLSELYTDMLDMCLDRFEQVSREGEFLSLDVNWVVEIVSHDELNVDDEYNLFEALRRWIYYDEVTRMTHLDELMSHIRFSQMEPPVLIEISSCDMISNSETCRSLIQEAMHYLLLKNYPDQQSTYSGQRFKKRTPLRRQQRIYAVGGWTNKINAIASVERYDPFADQWEEVSPMAHPRCGVGVASLGDYVFAFGGHDGINYLKSSERYDTNTDTWHDDVADMSSERTSIGVVELNGKIYAIGGQHGNVATSAVEVYDPEANMWKDCAPLKNQRFGAGVAAINGLIYVVGGGTDLSMPIDSVECYDPKTNEWTPRAPMLTKRKHFGCASLNGKLYAVGGRDDSGELNTAEVYTPELDKWEKISSMSQPRRGIGLVQLDGLLYAVGGHDGDQRLQLVEAYDPGEDSWSIVSSLVHARLGAGLIVHSKLNLRYHK